MTIAKTILNLILEIRYTTRDFFQNRIQKNAPRGCYMIN